MRLTKYEKEKIIRTSEGGKTYTVHTFDRKLKRRFSEFAKKFPFLCYLKREEKEIGSQTYVIDKARLSIRLTTPYSAERRERARISAKKQVLKG